MFMSRSCWSRFPYSVFLKVLLTPWLLKAAEVFVTFYFMSWKFFCDDLPPPPMTVACVLLPPPMLSRNLFEFEPPTLFS